MTTGGPTFGESSGVCEEYGDDTSRRFGVLGTLYATYEESDYTAPVRAAAFWMAIVLPFLHIPMFAAGLETDADAIAFVGLLALNTVAVFAGHAHYR